MSVSPEQIAHWLIDAQLARDRRDFAAALSVATAAVDGLEGLELEIEIKAPLGETFASIAFDAAYQLGDFQAAARHAEAELSFGRASNSEFMLTRALNNLGIARLELGQLILAEQHLSEALALASSSDEAQLAELRPLIAAHLAQVHDARGDTAALERVHIAPSSPRASSFGLFTDSVAADLATTTVSAQFLAQSGDPQRALEQLRRALHEVKSRGERGRSPGILLSNIAMICDALGHREKAVAALEEASVELAGPGCEEPLSVALQNLGLILLNAGRRSEAAERLKSAWELIRVATPRSPRVLTILRHLGLARMLGGDARRARAAWARGLELYDSIRIDVARDESAHQGLFTVYRGLAELLLFVSIDRGWSDEALDVIEAAKARFWLEQIEAGAKPAWFSPFDVAAVSETVDALSKVAGFNGLALNFFVGANVTFLLYGRNRAIGAQRIDLGEEALAALVDAFRRDLLSSSRVERWRESGRALASKLFGGLGLDRSQKVRQIYIMPDGPLWLVPFDALPAVFEPSGERLLASTAPTTIGPSLTILERLSRIAADDEEMDLVLIGHPTLEPGVSPIEGTLRQMKEIKRLAPSHVRTNMLSDERVVKHNALEAMAAASHIHIATHASAGDAGTPPHFLLAHGEHLTTADIAMTRLRSSLTFLAVCAGSYGTSSAGEGLASLSRAFLFAGSRCVIAPLWPVPDHEAALFAVEFYRRLFDGLSIAAALHETRTRMRENGIGIRTWAAFQAIGDAERSSDRISIS